MSLHLEVNPQIEARFNAAAQEKGIEPERLLEEMLDKYFPPLEEGKPVGQKILRGMFPQLAGLTEEDFKIAEFHGDPDDGLDWSE